MTESNAYIPALRFHGATRFYDWIMETLMKEEDLRRKSVEALGAGYNGTLLELGCGTGSLSAAIAEACPGAALTATDVDAAALGIAAGKLGGYDNVTVASLDATHLPADADMASFDDAICSLLLHHLTTERKKAFLQSVRQRLTVDGRLIVVDWGPPRGLLQKLGFWFVRALDGFDVTRANVKGRLPDLLTAAGFEGVSAKPVHQTGLGTVWLYTGRKGST